MTRSLGGFLVEGRLRATRPTPRCRSCDRDLPAAAQGSFGPELWCGQGSALVWSLLDCFARRLFGWLASSTSMVVFRRAPLSLVPAVSDVRHPMVIGTDQRRPIPKTNRLSRRAGFGAPSVVWGNPGAEGCPVVRAYPRLLFGVREAAWRWRHRRELGASRGRIPVVSGLKLRDFGWPGDSSSAGWSSPLPAKVGLGPLESGTWGGRSSAFAW